MALALLPLLPSWALLLGETALTSPLISELCMHTHIHIVYHLHQSLCTYCNMHMYIRTYQHVYVCTHSYTVSSLLTDQHCLAVYRVVIC